MGRWAENAWGKGGHANLKKTKTGSFLLCSVKGFKDRETRERCRNQTGKCKERERQTNG